MGLDAIQQRGRRVGATCIALAGAMGCSSSDVPSSVIDAAVDAAADVEGGSDAIESDAGDRTDAIGALDVRGESATDSGALADRPSDAACAPAGHTALHYAAGGGLDTSGGYPAGAHGFDLADISSVSELDALPAKTLGLVYLGMCNGADSAFVSAVTPFVGRPNLFGFYLIDEPDPTGKFAPPACPPANLKAESDWIHANVAGAKTFIVMNNMGTSVAPSYAGTYDPSNSGIDLYGLDPYPCRTELTSCDDSMIPAAVTAATSWGIPIESIVPVFQAFGGGGYVTDSGGKYRMPTVAEENDILATWASVVPAPPFDMVYSWGVQNGDVALSLDPDLQKVFAAHNAPSIAGGDCP